jgi:general secretion pathway protein C
MAALSVLRKLATALVWAGCAASAVAWGLRLSGSALAVPANAQLLAPDQSLRGDPLRLFSLPPAAATAAAPAQASRFRLVGVVAPLAPLATSAPVAPKVGQAATNRGTRRDVGVALLSLDGKPARAYRVGAAVDGAWVLQGVSQRGAQLGPAGAPAALQLELAALPPAATGNLTAADNPGPGSAVAAPPPVVAAVPAAGLPPIMPVMPAPVVPAPVMPAPMVQPAPSGAEQAAPDALRAEVTPQDPRTTGRKASTSR